MNEFHLCTACAERLVREIRWDADLWKAQINLAAISNGDIFFQCSVDSDYQRKQHVRNFSWEGATLVGTAVQGAVPCAPTAAVHGDV